MNTLFRRRRSPARAVLCFGFDFSLGLAFFCVLLALASFGQTAAHAEAVGWVPLVAKAPEQTVVGFVIRNWQWVSRDGLHMLLTLTFGVIMAVNLALARHLRRVAGTAR